MLASLQTLTLSLSCALTFSKDCILSCISNSFSSASALNPTSPFPVQQQDTLLELCVCVCVCVYVCVSVFNFKCNILTDVIDLETLVTFYNFILVWMNCFSFIIKVNFKTEKEKKKKLKEKHTAHLPQPFSSCP
jgi:hypothetical protein